MRKTKLVLLVNRPIIREGIANLLQAEPSIELVSKCSSVPEAIEAIKLHNANVVLIDIALSKDSMGELRASLPKILPSAYIIALTDSAEPGNLFPAILSGATGFISRDCDFEDLVSVITLASQGWLVVDPSLAKLAVNTLQHTHKRLYQAKPERIPELSKQERNVLSLMTQYTTNKELAAALKTSENTIKMHIRNILRKLEARNRREAVICAVEQDLTSDQKEVGGNKNH